jgi:hypothetical protein
LAHPLERTLERALLYVGISRSVRLFRCNFLLYSEVNITMCLNMQKFSTKQVQDLQTILTKTEAELKTSSQVQTFPSWATFTKLRLRCFETQDKCDICTSLQMFKHFIIHVHFTAVISSCQVTQQLVYKVLSFTNSCNLSLYINLWLFKLCHFCLLSIQFCIGLL